MYEFELKVFEIVNDEDEVWIQRRYENEVAEMTINVYPNSDDYKGSCSVHAKGESQFLMSIGCVETIRPADGSDDNSRLRVGNSIRTIPLNDCKDMKPPWSGIYFSILEADKIVRALCPGYCILQSEYRIADYKRREELYWDETRRIDEILLDMFFKKKGIDPDEHEDEAIELTIDSPIVQEFLAYKEEYLKDHPEQTDNALREKYDLKIYGGSDEDISDIISLF